MVAAYCNLTMLLCVLLPLPKYIWMLLTALFSRLKQLYVFLTVLLSLPKLPWFYTSCVQMSKRGQSMYNAMHL